jgi:hypothetical protein
MHYSFSDAHKGEPGALATGGSVAQLLVPPVANAPGSPSHQLVLGGFDFMKVNSRERKASARPAPRSLPLAAKHRPPLVRRGSPDPAVILATADLDTDDLWSW